MKKSPQKIPLVYSCSGCSSAAQMANYVALQLHKDQCAQMSCIAGIGGKVEPLVKLAKSNRNIVALDGCPLHCVKKTLQTIDVTPKSHFTLSELGVKKCEGTQFDLEQAQDVLNKIKSEI